MNVWSDTKSFSLCLLAYLGTIMEGNHLKIASTVDSAEPFCWRIEEPYMAVRRLTTVFCSPGLVAAPVPTHLRLCCCSSHSYTHFMQLSFGLSNSIFRHNYLPSMQLTRREATLTLPNPISYVSDPPFLPLSLPPLSPHTFFPPFTSLLLSLFFCTRIFSLPYYPMCFLPFLFKFSPFILSCSTPFLIPISAP